MGKGQTPIDLEADDVPVEEQDLSSAQETAPLPWFAGQRLVALRWLSPALEMTTKQAKTPAQKK